MTQSLYRRTLESGAEIPAIQRAFLNDTGNWDEQRTQFFLSRQRFKPSRRQGLVFIVGLDGRRTSGSIITGIAVKTGAASQ